MSQWNGGKGSFEHCEAALYPSELWIRHQKVQLAGLSIRASDANNDYEITLTGSEQHRLRLATEFDWHLWKTALNLSSSALGRDYAQYTAPGLPIGVLLVLDCVLEKTDFCVSYLLSSYERGIGTVGYSKSRGSNETLCDRIHKQYSSASKCFSDTDTFGVAAIHVACIFDLKNVLERLLDCGVDPNLPTSQEHGYQTPLHCCLHNEAGSPNCFSTLIERGASTHIPNAYGMSVLHIVDAQWPGTYFHSLLDSRNDVLSSRRGSVASDEH
ncbi:Ankyrin repeat protein 1 [Giardia muris]|uniref:Ankyrin repeat protein 1 n=1 Tax=Giardia muris TaxID=5742 RepID=A0A4Z1TAG9_GIAMU|nr:Ankyrin repeat protein 1 [Giardia muris]|eukprot:TNJ30217.1 Ankyrin repeat protein 1 [Giardia muris]